MKKRILRGISGIMLLGAIVFLAAALTHPEFGIAFSIGNWTVGSDVWRIFYMIYLIFMIALFAASFLVDRRKKDRSEK